MLFVRNGNLILRFTALIRGRNTHTQHDLKRERAFYVAAVRNNEKIEWLKSNKAVINWSLAHLHSRFYFMYDFSEIMRSSFRFISNTRGN